MVNKMRELRIEKITLNMCFGNEQEKIDKGMILLERITGSKPVKTRAKKRIPTWNIRPGLPIGCKVTLRGNRADDVLKRLIVAKDKKVNSSSFDEFGNMSFGVPEYIDIPNVKYDPDLGILGLQVCVTFERAGFRIKKRRLRKANLSKGHCISKQEVISFVENKYKVEVIAE